MAMWNQSRPGGLVMPALTRIERSPEQPSVNAVSSVSVVCADIGKAAPDQRLDRGIGLCHCGENLTGSVRRFDVAETDFEMPLAILTAPDEG